MLVCTLYSMLSRCCSFLYIWQHYIASLQQQWTEIRPVKSLMLVVTRAKPPPKKLLFSQLCFVLLLVFIFRRFSPRSDLVCGWFFVPPSVRNCACVFVCVAIAFGGILFSLVSLSNIDVVWKTKKVWLHSLAPHTLFLSLSSLFFGRLTKARLFDNTYMTTFRTFNSICTRLLLTISARIGCFG